MQAFFSKYLPFQRALSPRTVESYRDALRLLLEFIAMRTARPAAGIELGDFTPELIQAFPDHLESALRVPMKRFTRAKPQFLSREQMLAIIGSADGSWIGRRDHALLSLLYDTAATVSEVVCTFAARGARAAYRCGRRPWRRCAIGWRSIRV